MSLSLELFDDRHIDRARRFNARLREANGDSDFLLPEKVGSRQPTPGHPFRGRQWILLDDAEARGSVLLQELECVAAGRPMRAANIQAPFTEGSFRPGYAHLGPMLMKLAADRIPLLYAVGMGSPDRPLPKLLKALRWHVALTGFFFRAGQGSRLFKELAPLQRPSAVGIVSSIAGASGLGGPAIRVAHALSGWKTLGFGATADALRPVPIEHWGDWADPIWEASRPELSFAAVRDARGLRFFYPLADLPPSGRLV